MAATSLSIYCFVPCCVNTKVRNPDKLFFNVPRGSERIKWMKAVGRREPLSEKSTAWCCDDHFTLHEDVQDWTRYTILKDAGLPQFTLRLKRNVLPHIFHCQTNRTAGQDEPPCIPAQERENQQSLKVVLENSSIVNEPLLPTTPVEPVVLLDETIRNSTSDDAVTNEDNAHDKGTVDVPRKNNSVTCFVPACPNTRKKNPDKLFFYVPRGSERIKWTEAVCRKNPLSEKSPALCCEDHFSLHEDVQDWLRYKVLKEAGLPQFTLRLKRNVLPHIFHCQTERRACQDEPPCIPVQERANHQPLEEVLENSSVVEEPFCSTTPDEPALIADTISHSTREDAPRNKEDAHDKDSANLSEMSITSSSHLVGVNTTSSKQTVHDREAADFSDPSIASSSALEGSFEADISRNPTTCPVAAPSMVDSFTSPIKFAKDFTCQVRPHFRSKSCQAVKPVVDCGVMTSPIKCLNRFGVDNKLNDTLSSAMDVCDSSYYPDESDVTDISFGNSELDSFVRKESM